MTGVRGRDRAGHEFEARAAVTVGADGRQSVVARQTAARTLRQARASSAMFYSYWSGIPVDGYEFFYRTGLSAGFIPTNNGQTCVWAGIPSTAYTA